MINKGFVHRSRNQLRHYSRSVGPNWNADGLLVLCLTNKIVQFVRKKLR